MSSVKHAQLMDAMLASASSGKIEWSLGEFGNDVVGRVGDFTVGLRSGRRGNSPVIIANIYNEAGELIDSFDDDDLAAQLGPMGQSYWTVMNELLKTGRRVASGAESALDQMLKSLGEG